MLKDVEIREKLIEKIRNIEDEELLEHIPDLIDFESNEMYEMRPGEIEAVEDGIKQIENGQSLSHEEVKRQTAEWLKK